MGVESTGYGGTKALKAYGRGGWPNGLNNHIMKDLNCFREGDTWRISFKTRLYNETSLETIGCDPAAGGYECPMVRVHTMHNGTAHKFHEIRDSNMNMNPNASLTPLWSTFNTTFTIDASMVQYEMTLFGIMVVGGSAGSVLVVDDLDFHLVPP